MKTNRVDAVALLLLLGLLSACSTLSPQYQKPQIDLVAVEPIAAQGLEQRFRVHLRLTNPNDQDFKIKGMSYQLRVEGFNLVSGVARDLPVLPAYDSTVYQLEAGTNLLNGLRFIEQMMSAPRDRLSYSIEAVLDLDQALARDITVSHDGEFSLRR